MMEFNDDETSYDRSDLKPADHGGHFIESNAGHISVQTSSPFNMKQSEYVADQYLKHKYDFNILRKKLPKTACSSATSKMLVNQIIEDNNIDNQPSNYKTFVNHTVVIKKSSPLFTCNDFSPLQGPPSKEGSLAQVTVRNDQSSQYLQTYSISSTILPPKKMLEKITYCRPKLKYNDEIVNKTIERNARLEKLINELVIARHREKETEVWNNYINHLKNKHGYYNNIHMPYENTPYISENDTSVISRQQEIYDELLQEGHLVNRKIKCDINSDQRKSYKVHRYGNYPDCYPISSQGRLIMLQKGKYNNPKNRYDALSKHYNSLYPHYTIRVKRDVTDVKSKQSINSDNNILHDNKTQINATNVTVPRPEQTDSKEKIQRLCDLSENVKLKNSKEPIEIHAKNTLANIVNKLDTLIATVNIFINEVKILSNKSENYEPQSKILNDENTGYKDKISKSLSDTHDNNIAEKLNYDHLTENSYKMTPELIKKRNNINDIIIEELSNSRKAKADIENLLRSINLNRPQKMSPDIPNKEQSTKITGPHSEVLLTFQDSPTLAQGIKKHKSDENKKSTIARNTDPLGPTEVVDSRSERMFSLQDRSTLAQDIEKHRSCNNKNSTIARNTDPLGPTEVVDSHSEHLFSTLAEDIEKHKSGENEKSTKDRNTDKLGTMEVADSHSKLSVTFQDRSVSAQDIERHEFGEHQRSTIAINTDPLGLMALLHVSANTVKQLISYMLNIYYSSLVNGSQGRVDYACNICGSVFGRLQDLTEHIQAHYVGNTRNCCVCRHLLDNRSPSSLFRCRYCGKLFARAYCCDIHQVSCAKSFGQQHDVTANLLLLR